MPEERDSLRDWHRLFGLLLTDFFADSPFEVEVERDLSMQQQFLDALIIRRRPGEFVGRLPDGLDGLRPHNLLTFKSHHEALDDYAIKELSGLDVAYRKFVSPSPSELLPADMFGLYAVAARFPQKLSKQVPWHRVQDGVYDCLWGTDTVRVVVAGELSREPHNAPLHLFSASAGLVRYGGGIYRRRSEQTSRLLDQLFDKAQLEGLAVYTMEDFNRQYVKEVKDRFGRLTPEERLQTLRSLPPEERQQFLQSLPAEELLAALSAEQVKSHPNRPTPKRPNSPRKTRRKK